MRPEIVKKFQIAISPFLVDQKYPSGDQIQGLDASYLGKSYALGPSKPFKEYVYKFSTQLLKNSSRNMG